LVDIFTSRPVNASGKHIISNSINNAIPTPKALNRECCNLKDKKKNISAEIYL
jgi:hypothetical protein